MAKTSDFWVRKRNKWKNSSSYQFHKKNWKLEKKISKYVKYKTNVPDFIQQEAKQVFKALALLLFLDFKVPY